MIRQDEKGQQSEFSSQDVLLESARLLLDMELLVKTTCVQHPSEIEPEIVTALEDGLALIEQVQLQQLQLSNNTDSSLQSKKKQQHVNQMANISQKTATNKKMQKKKFLNNKSLQRKKDYQARIEQIENALQLLQNETKYARQQINWFKYRDKIIFNSG
eukprot:TRINITY_DN10853_c0_g1_i1.p2 TRINITY_DN10853_c0_g1~~TRINITY_DN10853_c0_g1_i1.p2  ORF type:complete len:159 (-),score=14.41 TRINITY_DN10853_c0_g1_i1:667-1143(-)